MLSTILHKLYGVGLDPTFGVLHTPREHSTPLAYDLMEPFRPCVDWRVYQWAKEHPDPKDWLVSKEFRKWVTTFPLEHVKYLDLTPKVQGRIEGVVRGFLIRYRRLCIKDGTRSRPLWTLTSPSAFN